MTTKEYDEARKIIEEEKDKKIRELNWEFVTSNNKYKKDDIIEDHIGKGKIEKMKATLSFNKKYPEAVYLCTILNKDNTPTKRKESKRHIFQSNIKETE